MPGTSFLAGKNLEPYSEGMSLGIPISAEKDKSSDLCGGAHMLADAGTDVEVADAYQSDELGGIAGQPVDLHSFRNMIAVYHLIGDRQVGFDEAVHLLLNGTHFLMGRLTIEDIGDFALFALYMRIA